MQAEEKSLSQRHKTRPLMRKAPLMKTTTPSRTSSYSLRLHASDVAHDACSDQFKQPKSVLHTFASDDVPSPFLDNTVLEKKRAAAAARKV